MTLQDEQGAFDAQLDTLRAKHNGEYVLFKDGRPVGFYPTHSDAFREGLRRFGLDAAFLVAQVAQQTASQVSISWELGIMFAK